MSLTAKETQKKRDRERQRQREREPERVREAHTERNFQRYRETWRRCCDRVGQSLHSACDGDHLASRSPSPPPPRAMTATLLIGSVPDGTQRLHVRHEHGDVGWRQRCKLERAPWLLQWLHATSIDPQFADTPVSAKSAPPLAFEGFIQVRRGPALSSVQRMSAEIKLLNKYMHRPLDAGILEVTQSASLLLPTSAPSSQSTVESLVVPHSSTQIVSAGQHGLGKWVVQPHLLAEHPVWNTPVLLRTAQTHHLPDARAEPVSQCSLREFRSAGPMLMLVLPDPFAKLLCQSTCIQEVLWLSRWPAEKIFGDKNWPTGEAAYLKGLHLSVSGAMELNPDTLDDIAGGLRSMAHAVPHNWQQNLGALHMGHPSSVKVW